MDQGASTLVICCGALAREVVALVRRHGWDHIKVEALPAHLHNTPDQIPAAVQEKIRAHKADYEQVLVLYSDCGTGGRLDAMLAEEGVERICGSHCYELFMGRQTFGELMAKEPGCFFLTDFLARHFDRLIIKGLGLDRFPKLRSRYFGKYTKLVYLAQTDDPTLHARAEQAAAQLGLAFELRRTGYGEYESFLAARAHS
jgi:hypothetical protein